MSFCTNCGKELKDDELFCSECGNAINTVSQQPIQAQQSFSTQFQQPMVEEEKKTLATCALAFAFLMPIVGFILGIIGTVKYKSKKLKKQCIAAIPISIVVWIICILIML